MKDRYVVIMAGGRGERFWPQSRLKKPKHLQKIVGNTSMLSQTLERLDRLVPKENIFVITNKEQADAVLRDSTFLTKEQIIAEPIGKDTAAAVALALALIKSKSETATFALLPADHVIVDTVAFTRNLEDAFDVAEESETLVTVGIVPQYPATGYGYIHKGALNGKAYEVLEFVEKPDQETAENYLTSGEYFWNAGMFVWSVEAIEKAFKKHAPEYSEFIRAMEKSFKQGRYTADELLTHYEKIEKLSIDYAIMEKADNVKVVASSFDWDDVGEWPAIARHYSSDADGNVLNGNAVVSNGHGNIVVNDGTHLTALLGVENLIVVQTEDATLICSKEKAQLVKELLKEIADKDELKHLL